MVKCMVKSCKPSIEVFVPRDRRNSDPDPDAFDNQIELLEQCIAGFIRQFFPGDSVRVTVLFSNNKEFLNYEK